MRITITEVDPATRRVTLNGRLDVAAVEAIGVPLATVTETHGNVIVDMAGVDFITSIGVRHLVLAAQKVMQGGGKLVLLWAEPERRGRSYGLRARADFFLLLGRRKRQERYLVHRADNDSWPLYLSCDNPFNSNAFDGRASVYLLGVGPLWSARAGCPAEWAPIPFATPCPLSSPAACALRWSHLVRPTCKIRRIEVIFSCDAYPREQRIAARVGQRSSQPVRGCGCAMRSRPRRQRAGPRGWTAQV